MKKPKFIRQESVVHLRLGKRRKKLQSWRRPKGGDSKMRLKRKSYPFSVSIGYKSPKKTSGLIQGLKPVLIHNTKELNKLDNNSIAILAKIGNKKRLEIISEAEKKKIKIANINGLN